MQPQSTISFVPNQQNSDQFTGINSFEPLLILIVVGVVIAALSSCFLGF